MNNARFKSCPRFNMRVIAARSKRLLILVDWNKRASRKSCGQSLSCRIHRCQLDFTLKCPYLGIIDFCLWSLSRPARRPTIPLIIRPRLANCRQTSNDDEGNSHYDDRHC